MLRAGPACHKGGGFRVITILFSLTWNSHALAIPFKGKCFHNQMHSINYYNHQLLLSVSVSSNIKVEVWGVLWSCRLNLEAKAFGQLAVTKSTENPSVYQNILESYVRHNCLTTKTWVKSCQWTARAAANLQKNGRKRKGSTCFNGQAKAQTSTWLMCCGRT